jgi:hypothetical protein
MISESVSENQFNIVFNNKIYTMHPLLVYINFIALFKKK